MNRAIRTSLAQETVQICEAGYYISPAGKRVDISALLARAKGGTILYAPDRLPIPSVSASKQPTRISVRNETTFEAVRRLASDGNAVACLNFASARNPGGGFLNGSSAQEEALARSSGLYPCLLKAPDYYESNRANRSALYLDLAIFSPEVPFFRDDHGRLLDVPVLASVITVPAPNAGAISENEPGRLAQIKPALERRVELTLRIAHAHQIEKLVLGAWGCGVFRNDPRHVAAIFAQLLKPEGKFHNKFVEVAFAVLDSSDSQTTYRAFAQQFGGNQK